jgi:heme-degrading monooxygenase HmoA
MTAIEIAAFRTDASEETLIPIRAAAIAAISARFSGLASAELFRGAEPGEWIDVVRWDSLDEATTAAEGAPSLPEAEAYFGLITEPPTMIHGTLAG